MKNLIGKTVKNYQVLLKVRETATRVLYRAYDPESQKYLGLEVIKIENVRQKELLALLREQAEKCAHLNNPNIAPLIDSGIDKGILYLVFGFSPVRTLRRIFNQTLSWNRSAHEFVTISQTLASAHQAGIVHGSLDPACILLDENDTPFLYDFGFESIIQGYLVSGTPGAWLKSWKYPYASPEQLAGKPVDPRSDVYSMGIILYEWMAGEIPLLDETALGTLYRRMKPSRRVIDPKRIEPPEIRELILKSIAPDPKKRYSSMQEFSIVLAREVLGLGLTSKIVRTPSAAGEKKVVRSKVNPRLANSLGAGLLVLLVVLAALLGTGVLSLHRFPAAPAQTHTVPAAAEKPQTSPTTTVRLSTTVPTNTPVSLSLSFPLPEGNALPATQVINTSNASGLVMIGIWGVGEINRFALSPDGKYIAAATSLGVFVYSADTFQPVKQLDTHSWVSTVAYSPDGKIIASGDRNGLIVLWDTGSWDEIRNFSGHKGGVVGLAFSPDGNYLASISQDDTLIKWTVNLGTGEAFLSQKLASGSSITYSPDGSQIMTGGTDWKVNLFDAKDLKLLKTINTANRVVEVRFFSHSSYIAVGTADRMVNIIDLEGKNTFRALTGVTFDLSSIAVSPDGQTVAAGDVNGGIVVWQYTSQQLWKFTSGDRIEAPASEVLSRRNVLFYSPDGKRLYSLARNGMLRAFDSSSGTKLGQAGPINNNMVQFAVSNDSTRAVFQTVDNQIEGWDIQSGVHRYTVAGVFKPGTSMPQNGQYFAAMTDTSTIKVYETSTGKELLSLNGHTNVRTINFVADGSFLAVWNGNTMRLWSISSSQEIKTEKKFDSYQCTAVSPLNKPVLFYMTSYLYVFEASNLNSILCGYPMVDARDVVVFDTINRQLIIGGYHKLEVRSFSSINTPTAMSGTGNLRTLKLAESPSGTLLAVVGEDNLIHIWSVASGTEIMSLYGHGSTITDLEFTRDGKLLISSSRDGTIRIWAVP